jgi:hypothetical protein
MKMHLVFPTLVFALAAFGQDAQQRWINSLKNAQVSAMEAGMPEQKFDSWLVAALSPNQPKYEMTECDDAGGAPAGEKPLCVLARADLDGTRTLRLVFRVGSYAGKAEKPAKIELVSGSISPANSRMKFPTRPVRKLSELSAMVKH